MFGRIRKLMSNVMPARAPARPSPPKATGWSERSGFTPAVRPQGRPHLTPPLMAPTGPGAESRNIGAAAAEGVGAVTEASKLSFEELVKLTSEWLEEKAYTASETLAVLKDGATTERETQIARDLGWFQKEHQVSTREMESALGFIDFRRQTNDGDPVLSH